MFESQITLEELMSKVSSFDIFKYYCPNFKQLGKPFCSEFRLDKNPSCNIKIWKGDLLYKDFGNGNGFRAIDYVMYKYNLGFNEAINKIYGEIGCKTIQSDFSSIIYSGHNCGLSNSSNSNSIIRIKKRDYTTKDIEYWNRYNISQEILNLFNVVPISHYWINDYFFEAEELAYSYEFYWKEDNSVFFRKIYQPLSSKTKWISNGGLVSQGEGMLPYSGKLLIITKSLKDVMSLYSIGYAAISPTSESSFLNEKYFNKQRGRFDNIVLWYDNDKTGIKKSEEFSNLYNIPYVHIPVELLNNGVKDISDYIKEYGVNKTKLLCQDLLGNLK